MTTEWCSACQSAAKFDPDIALADAAKEAGRATKSARTYLGQARVIRHLREQKAAMLEAARFGNIPALLKVRSGSDNGRAVVAACRQLETMGQVFAEETGGGVQRHSPGLIVQIVNVQGEVEKTIGGPSLAPTIDVTSSKALIQE